MPTSKEKGNDNARVESQSLAVDLLGTAGVTIVTNLAAMASVALLARILEREEFLNYTVVLRYFSLAIVLLGVGTGFSFIGGDTKRTGDSERALLLLKVLIVSLLAGLVPWVLLSVWLILSSDSWPFWTVLGYVWLLAHSAFVLSGPVARACGGVGGYVRLALGCRTAPYLTGSLLVLVTGEFMGMFVGFGLFSVFQLWRFWAKNVTGSRISQDWPAALTLLKFGVTRWLDDVVRTLLPVVLILTTGFSLGKEEAAVVALVYLVARVLESMLQPLVIALMMRTRDAVSPLRTDLLRTLVIFLVLSALVFWSRPLLEQLFVFFLGNKYQDVSGLAWLMLTSAGAIICLSYLRAIHDNRFSHSPVFFINLAFIVILVAVVMWCDSVQEVIMSAVLAHIGRLFCYAGSLVLLPGGSNDAAVNQ